MRVAVRRLDGVETVDVSLQRGVADLRLGAANHVTLEQLRQIIRLNGFEPREAVVSVTGRIIEKQGIPTLHVTGTDAVLRLVSDPSQPSAFRQVSDRMAAGKEELITIGGLVTKDEASELPDRLAVRTLVPAATSPD